MSTEHVQPTAEELALEQKALETVKEEDIRSEIITEYGFDETNDAEKIDKLTAKEIESRKKLSTAIGQKIKHRDSAKELAEKLDKGKTTSTKEKVEDDEFKLSPKDIIILSKSGIEEDEDIQEVIEYAKFKKISLADALKSSVVKATLAEKAEIRKTATATTTTTTRKTNTKPSNEEIKRKANEGKLPEPKSQDAEDLFWARRGGKR